MIRRHLSLCFLVTCVFLPSTLVHAQRQTDLQHEHELKAERNKKREEAVQAARDGDLKTAAARAEQLFALDCSLYGKSHSETIGTRSLQARIAHAAQNWGEEIEFRKLAFEIGESLYSPKDYRLGDLKRLLRKSIANAEHTGRDRQRLKNADGFQKKAMMLFEQGRFQKAITLAEQFVLIRREILGDKDPEYALSLNLLGVLFSNLGDHDRAESQLRKATAIRKQVLGKNHPSSALSMYNLGMLYQSTGKYKLAEPLYLEAARIWEVTIGKQDAWYANARNSLASLYLDQSEYARAEPLFQEAKTIREQLFGKQHPSYAASLNNLAVLYQATGDYAMAEMFYLEAKAIEENLLGPNHPDYLVTVSNLATLYERMGVPEQGIRLLLKTKPITEEVFGKGHRYAHCLNSLAVLYRSMNELSRAEQLLLEAKTVQETALGNQHPDYATYCSNLAELYVSMNDFASAEPLYVESTKIMQDVMGRKHVRYAASVENFGSLYYLMGRRERAKDLYVEANSVLDTSANNVVPAFSEAQAYNWVRSSHRPRADLVLAVVRRQSASLDIEPYSFVWKTKALMTRLRTNHRVSPNSSPEAKQAFAELRDARIRLARLVSATPKLEQAQEFQSKISEANGRKEELEKKMASLNPATKRAFAVRDATSEDLMGQLPSGVAVIDFSRLADWEVIGKEITLKLPNASVETRTVKRLQPTIVYDAFVLRSTADVKRSVTWVELGEAEPIDRAAREWRVQLVSSSARAGDSARKVRGLIWEKLEPHLDGCHTVIVLPDGELNRVPWAALPGAKPGSYLVEKIAIGTANYGQELYGLLSGEAIEGTQLLLAGGIAYDQREKQRGSGEVLLAEIRRLAETRGRQDRWEFLRGTAIEVETIGKSWGDRGPVVSLNGNEASEAAVAEALASSRYAHLATHGFFAAPEVKNLFDINLREQTLFQTADANRTATVAGRNPLLLSGVVVSGANLQPEKDDFGIPTGEDGILTSEEIAGLDLTGLELVTLSACETALGDVAAGEGVFGLQRAFHQSGARSVIASLWKVNDSATQTLMTEFYKNLWQKKMSKLDALRHAQLTMIRNYDPDKGELRRGLGTTSEKVDITKDNIPASSDRLHPNYWAAFQLSGDWR